MKRIYETASLIRTVTAKCPIDNMENVPRNYGVIIVIIVAINAATVVRFVCRLVCITLYQSWHKIQRNEENKNYLVKKVSAAFLTLPYCNNNCLAFS